MSDDRGSVLMEVVDEEIPCWMKPSAAWSRVIRDRRHRGNERRMDIDGRQILVLLRCLFCSFYQIVISNEPAFSLLS